MDNIRYYWEQFKAWLQRVTGTSEERREDREFWHDEV